MKTVLVFLCIIFCSVLTNAQNTIQNLKDLEVFMLSSGDYMQQKANNTNIIGSQYMTDDFEMGMVKLNHTWYEEILLKHDLFNDYFEVKFEKEVLVINPVKDPIDTIKYNGEIFVRKFLDPEKRRDLVFVALVSDGANDISLYKHYQAVLKPATEATAYGQAKPAEFKKVAPTFYISGNSKMVAVKGNKTVSEFFSVEIKALKKYLKENKYKISREEDLAAVVNHFSAL